MKNSGLLSKCVGTILLSCMVLVSTTNSASAQSAVAPTDLDLKAVYCLKTLQRDQQLFQGIVDSPISNSGKGQSEKLSSGYWETEMERTTFMISRVQRYLYSRFKYIDTDALLLASHQNQVDHTAVENCIAKKGCSFALNASDAALKICLQECNHDTGGVSDKLKSCRELSWLPF